jgi:hypothetical protein
VRRGVAILAFVVALLVVGSFVLWAFHLTASSTTSSLAHFISTGAFYGAESGLEMAVRELNLNSGSDIDSDGTIGSISDNGNDADDPALASSAFHVIRASTSPPLYRAVGRPVQTGSFWDGFHRRIEARIE